MIHISPGKYAGSFEPWSASQAMTLCQNRTSRKHFVKDVLRDKLMMLPVPVTMTAATLD